MDSGPEQGVGPAAEEGRVDEATRVTWLGILVNLVLTALKFAAAFLGHSKAMLADAVESLADLPASLVVLFGVRLAARPADETHDWGHGKIETVAGAAVGVFLLAAGLYIFAAGGLNLVGAWRGATLRAPGLVAFWASVLTIVTKEWLFRWTVGAGRRTGSPALVANAWHYRSDAVTSLGTLAGIAGAIFLGERWRLLDPLAGMVVSLLILRMGWKVSRDALDELVEASTSRETEAGMIRLICGVPGVRSAHGLRTRRIGRNLAVDVHIEVDRTMTVLESHGVADSVEERLCAGFGEGTQVTVHVEPDGGERRAAPGYHVAEK